MFSWIFRSNKRISLSDIPVISYSNNISFDRLTMGVDNIRYDVRLSPNFCRSLTKLIEQHIAKHSQMETFLNLDKTSLVKDRDEFKNLCREVVLDGINKSKAKREIQIDYLAQVAIIKQMYDEINHQFTMLIDYLKTTIRKLELSHNSDETARLKKELARIQQNKRRIIYDTGKDILEYFKEVQIKDVNEMRKINFGQDVILPDAFLYNPLLFCDDPFDDIFMIEEYDILLGRRIEDPDKYDVLINQIKDFLIKMFFKPAPSSTRNHQNPESMSDDMKEVDSWLMVLDNVDILFNYFHTSHQLDKLKKTKEKISEYQQLRKLLLIQKKLFQKLFREFRRSGLIERIIATYEMQSIYGEYCPPLVPQLIVQYFVSSRMRKSVEIRLKRLEKFYGKSYSLVPLRNALRKMRLINTKTKKLYFIRFLKGFIRYHRDIQHYLIMKDAMDSIHLAADQKIIKLSRTNNCLYEFLLSHERVVEEKPIINHVIVKADIRGSTDITHRMLEKGLNPASYFSLNLFDPITELLSEYGAQKVFVEGDAIILSIFELEDTPEGWYAVARACGLAMDIISIVQRCNAKSSEYNLPIIEVGVGISFQKGSPVFLFDGDHRIMISSAINHADRLSGCSKTIRKQIKKNSYFNLFVFQNLPDDALSETSDDLFLRYNVNGIELSASGFEKLFREIDFKPLHITHEIFQKKSIRLYYGKYPTKSGKFRPLIVREANIIKLRSEGFEKDGVSKRKYYEVCTHPNLYKFVDRS